MKKTRLIVCGLLLTVFLLLVGFSGVKTNATGLTTDANLTVEGASVRTTDPLGLRFVAKTGEFDKTKATAYGIVLAFGEVADLNELVIGGKVNGKTVANGEVAELNEFGTFAVTLIGEVDVNPLPEALYAQKITARAYVKTADGVVYGATATTRSLLECTLAAKNDGNTSEVLVNVLKYVDDNYVLVGKNNKGNLEVKSDLFELNRTNLQEEFIKDWNKMFGTNLTNLIKQSNDFRTSAATGIENNADGNQTALNSNLRKFFSNAKWTWLAKYIAETGAAHTKGQAESLFNETGLSVLWGNIKGLFTFNHFLGTLINFFNAADLDLYYVYPGYTNFTNLSLYDKLNGKNTTLFVNVNNYELKKVGDTLALDEVVPNNGYEFKGYTANGVAIEGLNYKLENKTVEILPVVNAINYTITLMDGNTAIDSTIKTYTINDEVTLPVINKEGASFEGWFEDAEFTTPVSKIAKGTTGNKTYYAKYKTAKTVEITFNYNNQLTNTEIVQEFVDDVKALSGFNNFLSPSSKVEHDFDIDFAPMNELLVKGKITPEFKAKWQWLLNYISEAVLCDKPDYTTSVYGKRVKILFDGTLTGPALNSTIYTLTQNLKGLRDSAKYNEGKIIGYDFGTDAKGFKAKIISATLTPNKITTLAVGATIAETPTKVGYTFDGWFNGDVQVTTVPETNVTLVAKWIKK